MATTYERIKSAVENEKMKKVRAEAQLENFNKQQEELLEQASTLMGYTVTSIDEVRNYVDTEKAEIERLVGEMSAILNKEGVSF